MSPLLRRPTPPFLLPILPKFQRLLTFLSAFSGPAVVASSSQQREDLEKQSAYAILPFHTHYTQTLYPRLSLILASEPIDPSVYAVDGTLSDILVRSIHTKKRARHRLSALSRGVSRSQTKHRYSRHWA